MRKHEQRLWDTMKRHCPKDIRLERVENAVGEGTPDVHYMKANHFGWVELKAPKRPRKATTRLLGNEGLRPGQRNWHATAAHFKLPAYVLIRDDSGELFLLSCQDCEDVNEKTVDELRQLRLASTWEEIFEVL